MGGGRRGGPGRRQRWLLLRRAGTPPSAGGLHLHRLLLPGDRCTDILQGFVTPPRAEPTDLPSHPARPARLSLAVGTPVQHPPTAHAAAGGERRVCRSATSAWSPASRLSRSPRWLSLGPRVPLWLSWDRAAPGAPGIPADPLQAGDRRARAPRALASPPRPSPPPSLLLFPGARG